VSKEAADEAKAKKRVTTRLKPCKVARVKKRAVKHLLKIISLLPFIRRAASTHLEAEGIQHSAARDLVRIFVMMPWGSDILLIVNPSYTVYTVKEIIQVRLNAILLFHFY